MENLKHFVQRTTYEDGTFVIIRRDYEEILDFYIRVKHNKIDGIRNFVQTRVFNFSFDRGTIHYDFYLDEESLNCVGIKS